MQNKLRSIQIFRGLACVLVVLYHIGIAAEYYFKSFWFYNIFSFGWLGVDGFFVLSGFIILVIHYQDLENRTNVKNFFIKRFIRIYPIYWILASVSLFFQIYTGKLSFHLNEIYILKSYLLLPQPEFPFLFTAWALIYECLFYLIFGLCISAGFKFSKYLLLVWLLLILIVPLTHSSLSQHIFLNPLNIEFMFGCLTGYAYYKYYHTISKYANVMLYLGLILFFIAVTISISFLKIYPLHTLAICIIFGILASVIVLGTALTATKKISILSSILVIFGESSYSIYLSHQIFIGLIYKSASIYFPKSNQVQLFFLGVFTAILAVFLGIMVYRTLEKRVIKMLHKLSITVKSHKYYHGG